MPAKLPQPAFTPARTPRTRQTQGIALVVVLLSAMVLMVSLLTVTSTMVVSSQRTTGDQDATMQSQYAAEAGLAYAKTRTAEAFALFPLISVPTNTTMATLEVDVEAFCGKVFSEPNRATLTAPVTVCDAKPNNGGTAPKFRTYSVFTDYLTSTDISAEITKAAADTTNREVNNVYLSGYSALSADNRATFWKDIFSGGSARSGVSLPAPKTGVTASFTPDYGFVPDHVDAIPGGYRLFFRPVPVKATANLKAGTTVAALRTLTAEPATPMFSVDIARRCFCEYAYFANRRMTPTGTKLVFRDGENFYGKVHVNSSDSNNGAAYFSPASTTQYAHFYGGFTTTATQRYWWSGNYESSISKENMFHNNYQFGADKVIMPENAASQKRAVIGGDPDSSTTFTDTELAAAYGKTAASLNTSPGVYYGKGQQKGNTWSGGIYVEGNVSDLKLTTNSTTKKQVITITQVPCTTGIATSSCLSAISGVTFTRTTTTFTQNTNGTWTMTEQKGTATPTTQPINAGFNGLIYVDGNIGSSDTQVGNANATGGLGGEGTGDSAVARNLNPTTGIDSNDSRGKETPDIAADMQITIAAKSDIYLKRNLTYTNAPKDDDPSTAADESTYNMLGIFSEQGNVKIDGVINKPFKIDGSLMAVGTDPNNKNSAAQTGKGFGAINYDSVYRYSSGNPMPKIELTGGIIEEQSQGVFSGNYGYQRDYNYDARFANGKTPPYFPTQGQFTAACFEVIKASVSTVLPLPNVLRPCTRNNEDVWIVQGAS